MFLFKSAGLNIMSHFVFHSHLKCVCVFVWWRLSRKSIVSLWIIFLLPRNDLTNKRDYLTAITALHSTEHKVHEKNSVMRRDVYYLKQWVKNVKLIILLPDKFNIIEYKKWKNNICEKCINRYNNYESHPYNSIILKYISVPRM